MPFHIISITHCFRFHNCIFGRNAYLVVSMIGGDSVAIPLSSRHGKPGGLNARHQDRPPQHRGNRDPR